MSRDFKTLAATLNSRAEYEAQHEEPRVMDALGRAYADELAEDDRSAMWVPPALTEVRKDILGAQVANMLHAAVERDPVVLPEHYARFKIEPIRFIVENALNFFQGNILKYVLRYDAKNGLEDLKKARRYLDMFIKWVEGNPDWWQAEKVAA